MNLEEYGLQTILIKNYKNDLRKVLKSLSNIRKDFPFMVYSYINSMRRLGKFVEEEQARKVYRSFSKFRALYSNELDFSYNIKNYKEGLKKLNTLLDSLNTKYLLDRNNNELKTDISKLHFEFYYFYRMHSEHKEALPSITRAIEFSSEKDIVKYKIELASLLVDLDNNQDAIKILYPLKKLDKPVGLIQEIYSILGFAYFNSNQIEKCIEIRSDLLNILEKGKLTDIVLARINLSMALLAKNLISDSVKILKNKNIEDFTSIGAKKISKNEAYILKLYFVAMAEIFYMKKNFKLARTNLYQAIEIGIYYEVASLASNHLFTRLARIELNEKNYSEAKRLFEEQYEYYLKFIGKNHKLVIGSMFGIVDCLMAMENYNDALYILKDLLKTIDRNYGVNSLLYGRCLGRIGKCNYINKRYHNAIKNYEKAGRIFNFYNSISIQDLITNHSNKSWAYYSLKNSKCIEECEQAIKITLNNRGKLNESLAQLYFLLSFYLQCFNQIEEGLMYINKAIDIITEIRGSNYFRNMILKDMEKKWGKFPMLFDAYSPRYEN